jgi:hypothetical protein
MDHRLFSRRSIQRFVLAAATLAVIGMSCPGCHTPAQWFDSLKGEGFPQWSEEMGSGMRGTGAKAEPSGFFTDRRSEQIEQNLGGGF